MPTLDIPIAASADDGFHRKDVDTYTNTTATFRIGRNATTQVYESNARFINVNIPPGFNIDVAYLRLTPRASTSGGVIRSNFYGHAFDNSPQITTEAEWHSIVDSGLTTNFTPWDNIPAWAVDIEVQSPSIAPLLQEMLDAGHLDSGIVHLFWLENDGDIGGSARRDSHSIDSTGIAPILHIESTLFIPPFIPSRINVESEISRTIPDVNSEIIRTLEIKSGLV